MQHAKVVGLALVLCSLLVIGGVSAQEDFTEEESELIEFVAAAFENNGDLESYSAFVEQTVTQEIATGRGNTRVELNNTLLQSIELQVELGDDNWNFNGVIEQDITADSGGQITQITLTLDMISIDGEFYAQVPQISPVSLASSFPDEWTNINEAAARYPSLASLNVEHPGILYNAVVVLAVDEDTVLAIEEADEDEIDGQTVRVFEVEYDTAAMLASESMATIVNAMAGLFPGVDIQEVIDQMAEGSEMSFTVWIGEDDELVHRIDSTLYIDADIEVMNVTAQIVQTAATSVIYRDFGMDFNVQAPDA